MRNKKWWTKERLNVLFTGIYSILIIAVLAFSLLTANESMESTNEQLVKAFIFLTFFSLTLIRGLQLGFLFLLKEKSVLLIIRYASLALIYLVIAVISASIYQTNSNVTLFIAILYLASIIINRLFSMFEKKKVAYYIFNGFAIVAVILIAFTFALLFNNGIGPALVALLMIIIIFSSLVEVLAFAFSKIKLKGLLKIIRKTYVFEILYGQIILIAACSFYFMAMEDNITTFWDGLWYSFAVVTTIGFGDLTVTGSISRLLSVILGVYGIIVVSSITSVIVNYYNEVKNVDTDKQTEEKAEIEHKEENNSEEEKNNEN